MNISVQKLLAKMETELQLAKNSSREGLREKVYSIKTLCELILEDEQSVRKAPAASAPQPAPSPSFQTAITQQPVTLQPQKLEMEDGANGDSLFDF